jgi:hypothetical protein
MFGRANQSTPPESEPAPKESSAMNEVEERARAFMALGFEAKPALLLAVGGASLSATRELIRKGCPQETALRILL